MEALVQAWLEANLLTQIIVVVLVIMGIVKGIIVIPWIKIGNKPDLIDQTLKVWLIKTKQTLYEQMNIVEAAHSAILFKMSEVYRSLNPTLAELQHYEFLIDKIESKCKSILRKCLKENHYTSRTSIEFELYIQEKIAFLIEVAIKDLNDYYRNDYYKSVSRQELQAKNLEVLVPFVKEKWRATLYSCREVSRDNEKRIKEIEGGRRQL